MKTFGVIVKLLTAIAAVAGAVYVVATYGDKVVAWAKKVMEKCPCSLEVTVSKDESPAEEAAPSVEEAPEAAPVEEPAAPEAAPVEEPVEAPAEEPAAEAPAAEEEDAPVADESEFVD